MEKLIMAIICIPITVAGTYGIYRLCMLETGTFGFGFEVGMALMFAVIYAATRFKPGSF